MNNPIFDDQKSPLVSSNCCLNPHQNISSKISMFFMVKSCDIPWKKNGEILFFDGDIPMEITMFHGEIPKNFHVNSPRCLESFYRGFYMSPGRFIAEIPAIFGSPAQLLTSYVVAADAWPCLAWSTISNNNETIG